MTAPRTRPTSVGSTSAESLLCSGCSRTSAGWRSVPFLTRPRAPTVYQTPNLLCYQVRTFVLCADKTIEVYSVYVKGIGPLYKREITTIFINRMRAAHFRIGHGRKLPYQALVVASTSEAPLYMPLQLSSVLWLRRVIWLLASSEVTLSLLLNWIWQFQTFLQLQEDLNGPLLKTSMWLSANVPFPAALMKQFSHLFASLHLTHALVR